MAYSLSLQLELLYSHPKEPAWQHAGAVFKSAFKVSNIFFPMTGQLWGTTYSIFLLSKMCNEDHNI